MNFGTVSLAAPQAASSRYRDIPGRIGASWRRPPSRRHQTRQQSAACWHRQQSGWHRPQRQPHQPTLRRCSAGPRSRTACAADRNRGSGHAYSWRRSSGPAPRHQGRAGRTSGRRGSGAPPRTTAVRSECHSSSQPAASGRAVRDQSKVGRSSYKMAPDGSEPLTNRQSDRSTSASGRPEHVAQVRLVKQCRLVDLPRTHHRFKSPPTKGK